MIEENVPLARHTTIGTGGAARWFARPETVDELYEALCWAHDTNVAVEVSHTCKVASEMTSTSAPPATCTGAGDPLQRQLGLASAVLESLMDLEKGLSLLDWASGLLLRAESPAGPIFDRGE